MKRFLVFDIGCIECGEDSAVVGTFDTLDEASAALGAARAHQKENWTGQHFFSVFDLTTNEEVAP